MDKTVFEELEAEDGIPHYEANHPKLQWLIILIPVVGAFALYTFIRIHNKRRKAKQLVDEETTAIAPPVPMTNIIPVPAPIFNHSNRTNNSRIYDSRTGIYPLIRLSDNSNIGNGGMTFWQRFQHSTSNTEATRQQQDGQRRRRRRRNRQRRISGRTPSPPPVYSISSPPKYDEVVALEADNETLAQVQRRICTTQQEH